MQLSVRISPDWYRIACELLCECEIRKIDLKYNHPNDVDKKCFEMLTLWLQHGESPCWCRFAQALYNVGLTEIAKEATVHLQISSNDSASATTLSDGAESSQPKDEEDTPNLHQLVRHLKHVPESDLQFFILGLLPKDRALNVIRDIRCNGGSRVDKMSRVCEAFLNEQDPSWAKVHRALKEAKCDHLADTIEACFLPI